MSDNELDNLFKEAAEGFTPPPDPSAWQQMASLLDKQPVKPNGFWNWKTFSALTVAGLVAVTAVWYGVSDPGTRITTNNRAQDGSNNATQGVVQEQKEQTNLTGEENLATAKSLENESAELHAVTPGYAKAKSAPNVRATTTSDKGQPVFGASNKTDEPSAHNYNNSPVIELPLNPVKVSETDNRNSVHPKTSISGLDSSEHTVNVDSLKKELLENTPTDSALHGNTTSPDKKESTAKGSSRLTVKVALSPDFSSINFFSAGKTGWNYGVLAGYSFNNRWSVVTGVISSRKLYETTEVSGSYDFNGHEYIR